MWRGQWKITQQLMSAMQWGPKMQQGAAPEEEPWTTSLQTQAPADVQPLAKQSPGGDGNKVILAFPELAGSRAAGWEGLQPLHQLGLGSPHPAQCLRETVAEADPGGRRSRHNVLRNHDFPGLRWGSSAYSLWESQEQICAICERLQKGV